MNSRHWIRPVPLPVKREYISFNSEISLNNFQEGEIVRASAELPSTFPEIHVRKGRRGTATYTDVTKLKIEPRTGGGRELLVGRPSADSSESSFN